MTKRIEKGLKPILKWVGGKTQLLPILKDLIPENYGRYIEPFIGGGALFFALNRNNSIISDANEELINLYQQVAKNPQKVIDLLKNYKNEKEEFYRIRAIDWKILDKADAAARMIYLNRTCFNGLYRVNKKGGFNVPYGNYHNPKIINEESILEASKLLQKTKIICGDYKKVCRDEAKSGDLIFFDPPYLPISEFSDFKRYTKDQFYEDDQRELGNLVDELVNRGCYVILTNSNHPLVYELYANYDIEVYSTKRNINSNGGKRLGEDVVVFANPDKKIKQKVAINQIERFPGTRYMGSKSKLINHIAEAVKNLKFESVLDIFSGSGVVSYMFKCMGKKVISNDYMKMNFHFAKAMIENNNIILSDEKVEKLLKKVKGQDDFVTKTFQNLYFSDFDNEMIDRIRNNIKSLSNKYEQSIAISALSKACIKKRPRGIFTYIGFKYDDGRNDLKLSLEEQFRKAVKEINQAIFDNKQTNIAQNKDSLLNTKKADLVYFDPPYYSIRSDNDYIRRYHFVEGLANNWEGLEIQEHTKTKKFKTYPTPFSTESGTYKAFDELFKQHKDSILVVSYSSNSLPTMDQMIDIIGKYKEKVEVIAIDYKYSFANQGVKIDNNHNNVKEYIFIGYSKSDAK